MQTILPQKLPAIFKESLTAPMLVSMLAVLDCDDDYNYITEFLLHLSLVPRFSVLVMFMTANERHQVSCLCDELAKNGISDDSITKIKTKYRIS